MDVESLLLTLWDVHEANCEQVGRTDSHLEMAAKLLSQQLCALDIIQILPSPVEALPEGEQLSVDDTFSVLCSYPPRTQLEEVGLHRILKCLPLFCEWLVASENQQAARTLADIVSLPGASVLFKQDMRRTLRILIATLRNLLDVLNDENDARPLQEALSLITNL